MSDPKEEEKLKVQGGAPVSTADDDDAVCGDIIKSLPSPSSLAGYRMVPAEFEKDDDTNHHIDFIAACANLRARNYKIAEAEGFPAEMPDADFMRLTQLPGTLIFNFMYTVFCTSWLSEKAPEVEPADIAKSSAVGAPPTKPVSNGSW